MVFDKAVDLWKNKYINNSLFIQGAEVTLDYLQSLTNGKYSFVVEQEVRMLDLTSLSESYSQFDFFIFQKSHLSSEVGLFVGSRLEGKETVKFDSKKLSGASLCYYNKNKKKVLMQLRDHNTRLFPGHYCFPGGLRNETKDNDYSDTAIREFGEETGIQLEMKDVSQVATHINFNGNSFYTVNYFMTIGEIEHFSCFEGASMMLLSNDGCKTERLVPYADIVAEYCFELGRIG